MPVEKIPVVTPIIHLNGDRKETLLDNLETAYRAVYQTIEALRLCAPNGRNYYPEPGRYEKAYAQYMARYELLRTLAISLEEEANQIEQENPTRERHI